MLFIHLTAVSKSYLILNNFDPKLFKNYFETQSLYWNILYKNSSYFIFAKKINTKHKNRDI